ncbi:PREDICTED: GDSL esterase/lipase At3g14820-like [Camelina sativa]|uniref:GDSL esterase/lipase At3g14820-like n=1 Tax=Camelina sativa TaxID=90675 RepID=A0ABM0W420_CAMSA|nr:PREDICTED: GDSL esterase/lipase At3g14820-like [Camelina sativa]
MDPRFICFLLLSFIVQATTGSAPTRNITVPALIVFGDSIMDTGNNNDIPTLLKANFPPYGRDFPGAIPTGRFSDGRVPSDIIAEKLGIAKTLPPYLGSNLKPDDLLKGVIFASGGSGYDPLTSTVLSVVSMSDQLKYFQEYLSKIKQHFGEEKVKFILEKGLFLVVSSSNDLAETYLVRSVEYSRNSYAEYLAQLASDFIKELSGLGAKNIGVFSGVPVGCVPAQRTLFGGFTRLCFEDLNKMALHFNSKLSSSLDALTKALPGRVVYIDVYETLLDIIKNPTKYGFEVADKGCCGTGLIELVELCNKFTPFTCSDPSTYVFFDAYHPSEKAYQIITDKLIDKYHKYLNN